MDNEQLLHIDCGGIDVEVIDNENGHLILLVDTWDRSTARVVAEGFGRITESDVTSDGRFSFEVRLPEDVQRPMGTGRFGSE